MDRIPPESWLIFYLDITQSTYKCFHCPLDGMLLYYGVTTPHPPPPDSKVYVMEERHSEVKMAVRLEPQLYSDQTF